MPKPEPTSDLERPVWAVIHSGDVYASGQRYEQARVSMAKANREGLKSLAITTDTAAIRFAASIMINERFKA